MNALTRLSPSITKMIRADHTAVIATFHKYEVNASSGTKRALVNTVCTALEIHAQLEEEIFYPEMRALDTREVARSVPEHDEMRRLIGVLRAMDAAEAAFDETFMNLMRDVLNHAAHEETVLLPDAERALSAERLSELGAQMTRRRMELMAPRAGEIAVNAARSHSGALIAGAGVLALGAFVAARAVKQQRTMRT
ncbi:MAG TPA: hemerythrin domain-containing protein [Casimicrobiaceae bacterium]|nr:hemerythrin domain-containing protein [Casimicrobiaceae bacterium]